MHYIILQNYLFKKGKKGVKCTRFSKKNYCTKFLFQFKWQQF